MIGRLPTDRLIFGKFFGGPVRQLFAKKCDQIWRNFNILKVLRVYVRAY